MSLFAGMIGILVKAVGVTALALTYWMAAGSLVETAVIEFYERRFRKTAIPSHLVPVVCRARNRVLARVYMPCVHISAWLIAYWLWSVS